MELVKLWDKGQPSHMTKTQYMQETRYIGTRRTQLGLMAFVDDYNAQITGPSAVANREGIQAIIDRAINWEK